MKLGDRVRMIRARYDIVGTIVDLQDAAHIEQLATLGRSHALALSIESDLLRGIAVAYEFQDNGTTITPTACPARRHPRSLVRSLRPRS